MAINRVDYPASTPASLTDWTDNISLHEASFLTTEVPQRIDYVNDLVLQGAVFQIGGTVYLADSDTAISGTPSDYVQITPSGATASAAYVADLTGVTWNSTYNGYYDGSGNLYVFDEVRAILASEITSANTRLGFMYQSLLAGAATQLYQMDQDVRTSDNVTFSTVNARGVDTFGGFMQSTTVAATTMPVGSVVLAVKEAGPSPERNEIRAVYLRSGIGGDRELYTLDSSVSSGTLTGSWAARGRTAEDTFLMQRIS